MCEELLTELKLPQEKKLSVAQNRYLQTHFNGTVHRIVRAQASPALNTFFSRSRAAQLVFVLIHT